MKSRHARSALAFVALTTITACGQIASADAPSVNTNTPNSGAAIAGNAFAQASYCQQNPAACRPATPDVTSNPNTTASQPTSSLTLSQGTLVSDQCFGECSVADGNEHNETIFATATNGLTRAGGYLDADAIPYFVSDPNHLTWHEQRDIGATCAGTTQSVTFELAKNTDGSSTIRKTTFSVGHCNPTPRQCLCVYEF